MIYLGAVSSLLHLHCLAGCLVPHGEDGLRDCHHRGPTASQPWAEDDSWTATGGLGRKYLNPTTASRFKTTSPAAPPSYPPRNLSACPSNTKTYPETNSARLARAMKLLYAVAALAALGSATPLGSVPNAAPIAASFPIDPPKQCTAFLELPRCCPEPTTDLKVSLGPLGVVFDDENGACKAGKPPPRSVSLFRRPGARR